MNKIDLQKIEDWYSLNHEKNLYGLRILYSDIQSLISQLPFKEEVIGYSENNLPIHKISVGNGAKRILIWSQMHGNESTGTKALFDLFNFFNDFGDFKDIVANIFKNCTISIIPMLNPDGAINYTRENYNGIDLNRDAVDLKARESKILRKELDSFKPHFCFNLHDQRTIFNVSGYQNPATLSFLAPSEEISREVTAGRKETMSVIVAMNSWLQNVIPNHIGRYTDEFYPTATGDNFQKMGYNTILVEAGHFPNDYSREIVRKYNFFALLVGLQFLASTNNYSNFEPYFEIPNNDKKFYDIIYRNVDMSDQGFPENKDIGVLFRYKVENGNLISYEHIEQVGSLEHYFAHTEIDLEGKKYN